MIKRIFITAIVAVVLCSFSGAGIKGVWQYCGGVYNGKPAEAPTAYTLHRNYNKNSYEAFVTEPGLKPERYEAGAYSLKADSCLETQTFCSQPSQTLGITIKYNYTIANDTLTFRGILPNGTTVVEYWKKVK